MASLKRKRRYLIYYVTSLSGGQILPPSKIILFLGISVVLAATGLHSAAATASESAVLETVGCCDDDDGCEYGCEHK